VSTGTGSDEGRMNLIDRYWLDSHLFDREEEGTANAIFLFDESDQSAALVILLGEADILAPEINKSPFRASAESHERQKSTNGFDKAKRVNRKVSRTGSSCLDSLHEISKTRFRHYRHH
jgi:hypothetical protein